MEGSNPADLYEEHHRKLIGYAINLGLDYHAAEDAVQNAFELALTRGKTLRGPSLVAIVKHMVHAEKRRRYREGTNLGEYLRLQGEPDGLVGVERCRLYGGNRPRPKQRHCEVCDKPFPRVRPSNYSPTCGANPCVQELRRRRKAQR